MEIDLRKSVESGASDPANSVLYALFTTFMWSAVYSVQSKIKKKKNIEMKTAFPSPQLHTP